MKQIQYRRRLLIALLLGVAYAGLAYRLVDLQVLRRENLQAEVWTNTHHVFQLEPRRGDILDSRGNMLATSAFVKTVCADPSLLGDHAPEVAHLLAPVLGMNEAELGLRLAPRARQTDAGDTVTNRYVVLKHKVPLDVWQRAKETMTNFPSNIVGRLPTKKEIAFYRALRYSAIFADPVDDQLRSYPNGQLAAHVLGSVGVAEHSDVHGTFINTVGLDGVVAVFDKQLSGTRGWRVTERDGHRRERVELREENVEPRDGLNLVLTIDSVIQGILETALAEANEKEKPLSISGIVMRPKTGEILGFANLPTFDPNHLDHTTDTQRRNRLISDFHEPGSTFKIVVISGALNDNLVHLGDRFNCEMGRFSFAGHTLHDSSPHGELSVSGIIMKSSNIGAAKVGILMQKPRLDQYMRDFGFGAPTGIRLPGETPGLMPHEWTKVSIAQIPMGQGVAVTSIQMTMAMAALANKGVLMRPMLVDRLVDAGGNVVARYPPVTARRVISETAAKDMVEALKTVVGPDGTAVRATLEHYTVAGKTGTAQKVPYSANKWYASFVGFFPADNPEVCIYIAMDEPHGPSHLHQGGQVCAPVFKQVAEKVASYLNVRPDKGIDLPGSEGTNGQGIKTVAYRTP